MRGAQSCFTLIGAALFIFGLLLIIAVLASYAFAVNVPSGRLIMLAIFLVGFWGLGAIFLFLGRSKPPKWLGGQSDEEKSE
jgi:hypothetical protein